MKLALKFTLAFLLGMSLVCGVEAILTCRREIAFYEADTRRDQHVLGRALATATRRVWQHAGRDVAVDFLQEANHAENHSRVSVRWLPITAAGASQLHLPSAEYSALEKGAEVSWIDRSAGGPGRLYTYVPVDIPGDHGVLELSESLADQEPQIRAIISRVLIATAEVTILCSLLALVLGLRLVGRPVSALIRRAKAIASGDLQSRLSFRQHDELGELGNAINLLSDDLREARERVDAEHAARIATIEQLRHADRLKTVGQLASGVAHELGTPLNVIAARAKRLAGNGSGSTSDNAHIIAEQADRMTRIIRQLLDFARPRPPHRTRRDLRDLVAQCMSLLDSLAKRCRVRMELKADDTCIAQIDPDQMVQVVSNLMVNGIQAMPSGGRLTISLARERLAPPADHGGREEHYVRISVQDEGMGIQPDALSRVFEPFFTTKDVGSGTGLGLSVSQGIIREHGGWISVVSDPGAGACFCIYLPQCESSVSTSAACSAERLVSLTAKRPLTSVEGQGRLSTEGAPPC